MVIMHIWVGLLLMVMYGLWLLVVLEGMSAALAPSPNGRLLHQHLSGVAPWPSGGDQSNRGELVVKVVKVVRVDTLVAASTAVVAVVWPVTTTVATTSTFRVDRGLVQWLRVGSGLQH